MDKTNDARAERLAAKLRENLKRRKAQARMMGANGDDPADAAAKEAGEGLPDGERDR
jgi:hypothetical protein